MFKRINLTALLFALVLTGCVTNETEIENGQETEEVTNESTNSESTTEELEAEESDNQEVEETEESDNQDERVVSSTDEALDYVFANVQSGGGLNPEDKSTSTVDQLDDGYMVHVISSEKGNEMAKFKVYYDGTITPGIVTNEDEAIDQLITVLQATEENFASKKYTMTATSAENYNYMVTVTSTDQDTATEDELAVQGTYTIGPDGAVVDFNQA